MLFVGLSTAFLTTEVENKLRCIIVDPETRNPRLIRLSLSSRLREEDAPDLSR